MQVNSDFKELLSILNEKGVKYLVIGGYAVIRYAEPRYTKDLDIWVLADAANAQAIFSALRAFGAPLSNLTPDDFAHEGTFYQMGVPPVRVDILMSVPGLSFEKAWQKREMVDFDGVPLPFIALNDIMATHVAVDEPVQRKRRAYGHQCPPLTLGGFVATGVAPHPVSAISPNRT